MRFRCVTTKRSITRNRFVHTRLEIVERAQVDVRRVVPTMGQVPSDRHPPFEDQPATPVGEIRERHDAFAADAQHLVEHHVGTLDALQRLGHHHEVEAVGREVRESLVEVLLDHVYAVLDTDRDMLRIDLEAVAVDALVRLQVASRSPSPQPRSSTRAPGVTRSAMIVRSGLIDALRRANAAAARRGAPRSSAEPAAGTNRGRAATR